MPCLKYRAVLTDSEQKFSRQGERGYSVSRLGGPGDRFGDYLCVDCAKVPRVSGHNQFTNAELTRPITKISKSIRK